MKPKPILTFGLDHFDGAGHELKAEMEAIQQQMVEARKNERANALKKLKRLCIEFNFNAGLLKGALAKGQGDK